MKDWLGAASKRQLLEGVRIALAALPEDQPRIATLQSPSRRSFGPRGHEPVRPDATLSTAPISSAC